jgi:hypothetical protein
MNEIQQTVCDEAAELAQHMPTEAVIDLIKEGYHRLQFVEADLKPAFLETLKRLEAVVDSREPESAGPVSFWGSSQS